MKVLITGTSSGIGKAIAEKFLSVGHEAPGKGDVERVRITRQSVEGSADPLVIRKAS